MAVVAYVGLKMTEAFSIITNLVVMQLRLYYSRVDILFKWIFELKPVFSN